MSNVLTSSRLINSIKRRGMIPSDQNTFTDQDFLDMLNEEIQYFGVPHLLRTHEEYLVTSVDLDVTSDSFEYEIPSRAIGNKLREVSYVDPTTNSVFELSRISLEDLTYYNENFFDNRSEAFYVQGNRIILVDDVPFNSGKLRMHFYLKPNTLTLENRTGIITSIDRTTGQISVADLPDDFANLPLMDFVQSSSPNSILGFDITPSSVNTTTKTITFTTTNIPDQLVIGDHVNFSGETIVPQLPTELHPILAQRVAVAVMEALGDAQGVQIAQSRLDMMEKAVTDLIDNRVEGAPEKINSRHSPLRESVLGSTGNRRKGRY